jgi:hypothetical protein
LWVVGVKEAVFPEDEGKAYRMGERTAKRRMSRNRGWDIEPVRWTSNGSFAHRLSEGDLMVQVFDSRSPKRRRVLPAGKVLAIKRTRSRRGARAFYVYLELPSDYRTVSWPDFKRASRSIGLHFGANVSEREIRDRAQSHRLFELTSPDRLRRK